MPTAVRVIVRVASAESVKEPVEVMVEPITRAVIALSLSITCTIPATPA